MYCIYTFSIANTKCGQHRRSIKGWTVVQKMKTGWRRACYGLNGKKRWNAAFEGQHFQNGVKC